MLLLKLCDFVSQSINAVMSRLVIQATLKEWLWTATKFQSGQREHRTQQLRLMTGLTICLAHTESKMGRLCNKGLQSILPVRIFGTLVEVRLRVYVFNFFVCGCRIAESMCT